MSVEVTVKSEKITWIRYLETHNLQLGIKESVANVLVNAGGKNKGTDPLYDIVTNLLAVCPHLYLS
ncbi:hypothetical protein GOM49_14410 [Clostridium bovifaecis]|uniref:Uncharacterized protein n=1 Tax=Clostridium bovifaecis TaxID=2184719 RepID=A0A6I6F738_9CLOT|nr:hypothetical protein GOM49_14410 [Clostridium bovifaecis]